MKYKATKKFLKELGIENNYQFLTVDEYFALKRGESVECNPRPFLIENEYLVPAKGKSKMTDEPKEAPAQDEPAEEKEEE